jgi:hypothetical protein
VVGVVTNASQRTANRVVCYCDDCQAFAHQLGRADLLNANGGSDIVQVAPASLTFVKGQDRIAGVRLTPKGLFRYHTTCCNTPIGNTLSPAIPFVGILAQAFDTERQHADHVFGTPVGAIFGKCAIGEPPGRLHRIKPATHAARDCQGAWLAPGWPELAASLLQTQYARADVSADRIIA